MSRATRNLTLFLLVALSALAALPSPVHSKETPTNYVDLLFSGDQRNWPNWKHAFVRSGILDAFKAQCEAGELPWVKSPNLSRKYHDNVGILSRVSGSTIKVIPFPMKDYGYSDPFDLSGGGIGLNRDYLMDFGVYCMFVSPTVDVLLVCNSPIRPQVECAKEKTVITLESGFTWLLTHDRYGTTPGWFTIQARCKDRTSTCAAGGVTGIGLRPNNHLTAFTPKALTGLLTNPTGK